jgi:uncharacterized membrane protein
VTLYEMVKALHILSAAVLFGTGLGTAWFFWQAHCTGDAATIAATARAVVRADWLFTTPAVILQPLTGAWLVQLGGYSPTEPWLLWTYVLYVLTGACWLPVVWLQIRMRDLAAAASNGRLPPLYHNYARIWFALGWPAFIAVIAIVGLMVAKP